MARVNISIPDELHQRLEEIRQADATLNISGICQEALGREVARRDPLPKDIEITDDIVERLRSEKEDDERESRERGFLVGAEWARRAKFPELRRWGEYKPSSPQRLASLDTPPYEMVEWLYELGENVGGSRTVEQLLQSHPELRHAKVVWNYPNDPMEIFWFQFGDKRSFNEGFLEALRRVWELVKDRL